MTEQRKARGGKTIAPEYVPGQFTRWLHGNRPASEKLTICVKCEHVVGTRFLAHRKGCHCRKTEARTFSSAYPGVHTNAEWLKADCRRIGRRASVFTDPATGLMCGVKG